MASNAGEGALSGRSQVVKNLLGFGSESGWRDALKVCTAAFASHIPLKQSVGPRVLTTGAVAATWDCIPSLMKADVAESGVKFFGMGVVLSAVNVAVSLVLTGLNLVVTGTREVFDQFATLGGRSNPVVTLRVSPSIPTARASLNVSAFLPAHFASPSGRLICYIDHNVAACGVSSGDINNAPDKPECSPYAVAGVQVRESSGWLCSGGVVAMPQIGTEYTRWFDGSGFTPGPTLPGYPTAFASLPYGRSLSSGDIRCDSSTNGIYCMNTKTKASFAFNASGEAFTKFSNVMR